MMGEKVTSSFIVFISLSFLSTVLATLLFILPSVLIYYYFIRRACLYCRVTKELKRVMKERDAVLEQSTKKVKKSAKTEFRA